MTAPENRSQRLIDRILIGIFLAAIILPLAVQCLSAGPQVSQTEKRALARLPTVQASWTSLWSFPDRFAAYYADHFGLRSALIRLHALLKFRVFGVSPSRFVTIGRDGWLYYADDYSMEDYRSVVPFSDAELAEWKRVLEERRDWLAGRGIRFLVVLACDKYMIYPQYMPASIRRAHREYRVDQLADYLKSHSTLDVVYVRRALEAAAERSRIYQRTDTHWNDQGARVGYQEIVARLSKWFSSVAPLPADAFTLTPRQTRGMDLAVMMGLDDIITEENMVLVPRRPRQAVTVSPAAPDSLFNDGQRIMETGNSSLPRMVMFRDSFSSALVPFLAEHFSRSVFLWQYEFELKFIEREKPDVVILEIVGRRLQWVTPENPPLP